MTTTVAARTSNLITRDYNGTPFVFREDGYFNMTKAAAHFDRRLDHFWEAQGVRDYCFALATHLKVPDSGDLSYGLAIKKRGHNGGTWAHPKLAIRFAQWLDPEFAVWCDMMIEDILTKKAEVTIVKPEQSAVLVLDSITIKTDDEGRYCLNDLHKAAGGLKKNQPSNWLRLDTTKDLIEEVGRSSEVRSAPANSIFGGTNQGTYVCKELVYAYAMWISPAFHLKVIRAYDRLATRGIAVHENAAADLLKNPLKYYEEVLSQAKVLQSSCSTSVPTRFAW